MTTRAAALLLVLLAPAAGALGVGPSSQTLEAMRGARVDPERFFDGAQGRAVELSPVGYAPAPPRPATTFDSHEVAPGLTVHAPMRLGAPPSQLQRAPVKTMPWVVAGAGVASIAAGAVLGGSLALPLIGLGAALLVGSFFLFRS